ncbi:6-phosphogluconolactonase [Bowdeniella nasicola]|uniref:6-phosphogluconolactonase n=1 Tax=Bowdeniella nasicola TaxID=208480 RepID=A0A1Q5Q1G8_9ACTO|nr:6-phosphogluconolactonase [Bowdeniella nasicola]OKL53713.1 6-phosphogluconolactonase [Bowdeniella nasicola]
MTATITWQTFPDGPAAARAAGERLVAAVNRALAERERADVVLTGGSLGIAMQRDLNGLPEECFGVHVWWGDERFVPLDSPDLNARQSSEVWGDSFVGAVAHLIMTPDSAPTPEEAAAAYTDQLVGVDFDIVFLGMGPDGHIASLFPGHEQVLATGVDVVSELASPKPPPQRVSMTGSRLRDTRELVLLFAGEQKHDAARHLLQGARLVENETGLDGVRTERLQVPEFSDAQLLEVPARLALTDVTSVLSDVSAADLLS